MGPAAYKVLSRELPLREFPVLTLQRATVLHHFGTFDAATHKLDRPIWVSDDLKTAQEYQHFGVPAPFYTAMLLYSPLAIVDLNGISLQPLAAKLNMPSHGAWNRCLAEYLNSQRVRGFVYMGREIFLPNPGQLIGQVRSVPRTSLQFRR